MFKNKRLLLSMFIFTLLTIANFLLSINLHNQLSRVTDTWQLYNVFEILKSLVFNRQHLVLFASFELFSLLVSICYYVMQEKTYESKLIEITPAIHIPEARGQNQHGSARFLKEDEKEKYFDIMVVDYNDNIIKDLGVIANRELQSIAMVLYNEIESGEFQWDDKKNKNKAERLRELVEAVGSEEEFNFIKTKSLEIDNKYENTKTGIVLGLIKTKTGEKILCLDSDTHTIIIGATRCGKTRTEVLQTIGIIGLAGESLVLSDPKGELYKYTRPYLETLGYNVLVLDFEDPYKSDRYNFLQPVIDAVDVGDNDLAQQCALEIANLLVAESTSEPIWKNGELTIITASILSVVFDNKDKNFRKYQNLTNVFYFINEMCKPINEEIPLSKYIENMDSSHPANGMISVQDVAPFRTRASFNISALMTLNLFALSGIYQMTNQSDFDIKKIGEEKTAVFIILPDYTKSYYTLASLFVSQVYTDLVKVARKRGNRLKRRVHFVLDEFGNFAKIKDFDTKLTVGGGYGIRFNLIVQSFAQLISVYEETGAKIITGNCETWIYLQTDDDGTIETISKKLDKYTVSTYSLSSSHQKFTNASNSQSVNLTERDLLTKSEVQLIDRPFSLVTSRTHPAIMNCPDLSQWKFNDLFGLGDEEHNRAVLFARDKMRVKREKTSKMELWEVWELYQEELKMKKKEIRN